MCWFSQLVTSCFCVEFFLSDENENRYDSESEAEVGKIPPISLVNNNTVNNNNTGNNNTSNNNGTQQY